MDINQQQPQGGPPSQPKPGMTGGGADPAAAMPGQKGAQRTPEDPQAIQNELARGIQGLSEALYGNEQTSDAVLKMLRPNKAVDTGAKAALFVATQVIQKAQIAERLAVPLVAIAADEVMQMAEQTGEFQYSEDDAKNLIMAATEMMLSAYGVDPARAKSIAESASPEQRAGMEEVYKPVMGGEAPQEQPA